jgi:tetratricopeptide (TPR) repeat protein
METSERQKLTGRQNGDRGRPRAPRSDQSRRPRRDDSRTEERRQPERKTITAVPEGNLPRWVRDDLNRSTPRDRRPAALQHMEEGIARFADERFRAAVDHLTQVKALAPRAALARELLGLSYYYLENWAPALQELRAYRRFTGETLHMPVEIDCLRALKRNADVDKTYELFRELGGDKDTEREAAVVYASHLLDLGRVAEAWRVIKPGRLISPAPESEIRRWYVAARVALAANDNGAAKKFIDAIHRENPSLPGLDELKDRVGS